MKKCEHIVGSKLTAETHNMKHKGKHTRFVYNSSTNPSKIDTLLAKKFTKNPYCDTGKLEPVNTKIFWASVNSERDRKVVTKMPSKNIY